MFSNIFKRIWFLWTLCLILNIITLFLVWNKTHISPNKTAVLHYNVITGVDWYGPEKNLYQIPLAAFLITALNFTFFRLVKNTGLFYAPLAAGFSAAVQATLLFATLLILYAN